MTVQEIVKLIVDKEGKLAEVSVGNIREVIGIISDLVYASSETVVALHANGKRRAKKK